MLDYLPDTIRKFIIAIILALIPLLIVNVITSPIFEKPEIDLTLLERYNEESNTSTVYAIIQNTGNQASKNILVLFDTIEPYKLVSFESTDKFPKDITGDNKKLRLSIERLSPQTYVILETKGMISNYSKIVWVTSDKETEFISLPYSDLDSGISSVNLMKYRELIYLYVAIFGVFALLVFRYVNFHKSETSRRRFLGIYPIPLIRFGSKNLISGLVILAFGIGGGWYSDLYYEPEPISNYLVYDQFFINNNTTPQTFLQISDPAEPYSNGNLLSVASILVALMLSNRDIKLPKFIWALSKPLPKIRVNEISSSYLSAEEIAFGTRRDLSQIDAEVLVVKDKNSIIGLITTSEAERLKLGKNPKLKNFFDEKSDIIKDKIEKKNFVITKETITLDKLKEKMENESKIYAVILDEKNNLEGVVEYNDLFGKPKIFH